MADGIIKLIWFSDNRTVIRDLQKLRTQSEKTAATVTAGAEEESRAMKGVGVAAETTRGLVGKLAGGLGFLGLAFGIKDVVKGGMDLQAQQTQLQSALKSTGLTAAGTYSQLQEASQSLATKGGFSNTENLAALTSFVRETRNATTSTKMLSLATSIARGTGNDLASTSQLVARAYTGQVGRLQKLIGPMVASRAAQFKLTQAHKEEILQLQQQAKYMGPLGSAWLKQQEIIRGITPQMAAVATLQDKHATATQFMAAATQVFAGATDKYSKTTAGRLAILSNTVKELRDAFGQGLLPIVNVVLGVFMVFARFLTRHKALLYIVSGAVAALTGALLLNKLAMLAAKGTAIILGAAEKVLGIAYAEETTASLASRAGAIAAGIAYGVQTLATGALTIATGIATAAMTALGIAMDALPIVALIAGIAALIYFIVTNFSSIVKAVKTAFHFVVRIIGDAVKWIEGAVKPVAHVIEWPFVQGWHLIKSVFGDIMGLVKSVVGWIGGAVSTLWHVVSWPFVKAWHIIKGIFDAIMSVAKKVANFVGGIFHGITHFLGGIVHGVGGFLNTVSFGLLAGGGVVRPHQGPLRGPRGTDRIHGWLSPGEGVLSTAAMTSIGGETGLNALNSGQVPAALQGAGGGMGSFVIEPGIVNVKLDSRTLATALVNYTLRRAARGPSSLSGGALSTGVPGTIDVVGGAGTTPA